MAKAITAVEVIRDECGYWIHPDFPDVEEFDEEKWKSWLREYGLEWRSRWMEDDPEAEVAYECYCNGDGKLDWMPAPPEGDGWVLMAISDTEDNGPGACFVRPIPA